MIDVIMYSMASVIIVSLISLEGVLFLAMKTEMLKKILLYLVSFSAGALIGGAFLHLIPSTVEESGGFTLTLAIWIIMGILGFFVLEKIIHWRHCHVPTCKDHPHPLGTMNLVGDSFHNFFDGIAIGTSYMTSIPLGISTTMAIILHEIPQEIGDFGVLLHAGYKKSKALLLNFLTALVAVLGVVASLTIGNLIPGFSLYLIPFTAGGFIYIATSDLMPELKKENDTGKSIIQLACFILGVAMMAVMLLFE